MRKVHHYAKHINPRSFSLATGVDQAALALRVRAVVAAEFGKVARLLKSGGRDALADIVTEVKLPESIVCNSTLWAACIGRAAQQDDYKVAIRTAGLVIKRIQDNPQ